jgi:hypothetical protein
MAFNIDDPMGSLGISLGGFQQSAKDVGIYVIWGVILLAVGIFIWMKYQDKKVYIYSVRIFKRRANGLIKEFNTTGGYIKKSEITTFVIKMGMMKKKELQRLPRSDLMDEEDRVYYYQLSPESPLVQCKRSFNIEQVMVKNEKYVELSNNEKENLITRYIEEFKQDDETKKLNKDELKLMAVQKLEEEMDIARNEEIDVTSIYYTPVPTDQKLQAYYDIRKLTQVMGVDVNKQFAYFVMGIIGLVVVGVIVFYIAINKGDVPILTKMALSLII